MVNRILKADDVVHSTGHYRVAANILLKAYFKLHKIPLYNNQNCGPMAWMIYEETDFYIRKLLPVLGDNYYSLMDDYCWIIEYNERWDCLETDLHTITFIGMRVSRGRSGFWIKHFILYICAKFGAISEELNNKT